MNLPNKLTMLRVFLIPVFVFFILAGFVPYNNYIALAVFIIASLTDMLDGKIARKRNLVTNFGKFMDPLADKLLVVSALLCLLVVEGGDRICGSQTLALIAIIIIVAREFIISGFRLVASDAGLVIAASMWGKFKTATTMVSICIMIVVNDLAKVIPFIKEVSLVIFWIAVTLTIVSLVDYLVKNIHVITDLNGTKKEEAPAPAPAPVSNEETGNGNEVQ
ncbi:MAG: CDP-diacylglycerol--glycerol-3-phosphate 3-phosphatidyltransferase [Lachnospiraceae bacterium]|nr:CDP-diacylglycerol--glycerol-3-phosphate 3-phosphatidyltransferase [Lachnospiraceae bacterium]